MLGVTVYKVQLTSTFRQNHISSLKLKGEPSHVRKTITRVKGGGEGRVNFPPSSQYRLLSVPTFPYLFRLFVPLL